MANQFLNPTVIAKAALALLKNNLRMVNLVGIDKTYAGEFGHVIGDTLTIRKPSKYVANDHTSWPATESATELSEPSTTITIGHQTSIMFQYTLKELRLNIEDFAERHLRNAMYNMANQMDVALMSAVAGTSYGAGPTYEPGVFMANTTNGSPGTAPNSFLDIGECAQYLNEQGVPGEDRSLVINPVAQTTLHNALKDVYFDPVLREILRDNYLGRLAGFDIVMDQNVRYHTAGVIDGASTPQVDGGSQTGTTLDIKLMTNGDTLTQGDIITLDGVYDVNPTSGDTITGRLKQFVIVDPVTVSGTTATITIYPGITTTGAYKTCSASPADSAPIYTTTNGGCVANHTMNVAFHRDTFVFVPLPMDKPKSCNWTAQQTDADTGISILLTGDYDITNSRENVRLDILWGIKTIRPEMACRCLG